MMLRIMDALAREGLTGAKRYLRLYRDYGYELGVGTAGTYEGHAHRWFYDIMFSPSGLECMEESGESLHGRMLIVPPRTYFRRLHTGRFVFLKFSPVPSPIALPDKVMAPLQGGASLICSDLGEWLFPWCPEPNGAVRWIRIEAEDGAELRLYFADAEGIVVVA